MHTLAAATGPFSTAGLMDVSVAQNVTVRRNGSSCGGSTTQPPCSGLEFNCSLAAYKPRHWSKSCRRYRTAGRGVAQHIRVYTTAGVDSNNLDQVGAETGQRSSSIRAIIGMHRLRVAIGTLNDDPVGRVAKADEQAQPCDHGEPGNRLGRASAYAVGAEANQRNPQRDKHRHRESGRRLANWGGGYGTRSRNLGECSQPAKPARPKPQRLELIDEAS